MVEAIERAGASVLTLPPYNPDYTPIEEMYSKVKGFLRRVAARVKGDLDDAIGDALRDVTPQDIIGWFEQDSTIGLIRPLLRSEAADTATALATTVQRGLARLLKLEGSTTCSIRLEIFLLFTHPIRTSYAGSSTSNLSMSSSGKMEWIS